VQPLLPHTPLFRSKCFLKADTHRRCRAGPSPRERPPPPSTQPVCAAGTRYSGATRLRPARRTSAHSPLADSACARGRAHDVTVPRILRCAHALARERARCPARRSHLRVSACARAPQSRAPRARPPSLHAGRDGEEGGDLMKSMDGGREQLECAQRRAARLLRWDVGVAPPRAATPPFPHLGCCPRVPMVL